MTFKVTTEQEAKRALDGALSYWAADREGVSINEISDAKLVFDEGWPGTDVTPGEPSEISITYTVTRHGAVTVPFRAAEITKLISELAAVARRAVR